MTTKRVAIVLAGCGYLDGSEIHEAVCALVALDLAGATVQAFAPDKAQMDVVDHVAKKPASDERNVLAESARIARSDVKPLSTLKMDDYDAVLFPGGFGAAKNLVDYAVKGSNCAIDPDVERVLKDAHSKRKPIGAMCIAPVIVARALGADHHPTLTIGNDKATAGDIQKLGAKHEAATSSQVVVDTTHRIVSTPAYMTATHIGEVWQGATKLVEKLLSLCS